MRRTTKKTALLASVALLITVTAVLGQRFTPIKNLRLDGNMDGNAQNITNVNSITAGSFIGDGSDLTGLPGLSSTGRVVSLTTENFEIDPDYNYQDITYGIGGATPPVTRTATLVDTPSPGETIFFSITASGFVPTTNVLAVSVPSTTWSQGAPEIPYGEKWLFMLFCAEEGSYDGYYIQETTSGGGVSGDQPWSNTDGDYVTLTNITELSVNDAGSTVLYANTGGVAPAPVHVTTNMQIDGQLILLTEGTATNAAITKNYVDTEIAAIPGPLDSRTATNNVDMGGFNITSVTNITFAGAPEGAGVLSWNADEETLDLVENGTTLQLGQELHINARNSTGVTITNGAVVSFAGTIGASSRIQIEPFLADGATDLYLLLGVATEDIEDGADGKVTHFGKVRGLDTSDWAPGTDLYASETVAGGFTTNAPSGTNQAIVVAIVINQHPIVGTIEVVPNWSDANAGDNLGNHTATTNLNMGLFPIILDAEGTATNHVVTKAYVDTQVAGAGDNLGNHTATTNLNMGSFAIVLDTEGTATNHVVTKSYVDTQVAGAADTDWTDSGDTLKSTNNTVLIAGAGLAANHDQLIVSNDVRVAFRVDEDGDVAFRSWYDDAVADGRSYAAWQEYFDFRHIVDYDEYIRIEGSVIEEMTFNMTKKNLDYIFYGDNLENLLYMDADTDSVNIHTNTTVSGYGFTVATNAYVIGPVALETEGTATNHLVTKAYVDTAVAGGGGGGLADVVDDATPQLGGSLDLNSNDITGTGNIDIIGDFTLEDLTDDAAAGPEFSFYRNSATPADGDYLGQIKFQGENDAGQTVLYAKITGKTSDVADTTEDGLIEYAVRKAGSNTIVSRLTHSALKLINGTGLEVNGNITTDGTVQGRDMVADGLKLDGLSTPPREYNLPAIGAPPYGGVSGSEAMAEQTVFATNSLSIVTLNFDETTEEIIGPYYLAMPNNVDTNTDFSVTFYSWGDAAGDVTVALGYEVGGLATPTWETNTFTVTTNYASFGQDTFTFDVNPADRAHTRWWIKRVAGDSGDTSAGDWNLVNTLLEAPRE